MYTYRPKPPDSAVGIEVFMVLSASISEKKMRVQASRVSTVEHLDMNQVAAVILGGGEGTRLSPLTSTRCKPAICFGGKYRLIDVPMSKAINSGIFKIYVITQYLSASLHQHLFRTYRLGSVFPGFLEILTAEQRPLQKVWFQGTADAIRQNIEYLSEAHVDYFLILSGDQLYNLDFRKMLQFAKETKADLVVAALPVAEGEAKRMGLLKVNEDRFITDFCEKPQNGELLQRMKMPTFTLGQLEMKIEPEQQFLGSMGIYLFKREALINLLQKDLREDFGKHLIPHMVNQGNVAAYLHKGYWEDIGTIESFYNANIALTEQSPLFNCYDEHNPIYSASHHLPPPKIMNTQIDHSIICDGGQIEADEVSRSLLGLRCVIKKGCIIRNSYVMGNDYYNSDYASESLPATPQIGENCILDRAIIDSNVCIGKNVRLINKKKLRDYTSDLVCIRDGIIVVPRGINLPDDYSI